MCQWCGDGWRFETTELGGPNAGRVKAVVHPIGADWENLFSRPSDGSVILATRDPAHEDIWPGATGFYISQVLADGSRKCHFGGYIPKYAGAGGGDTPVAIRSIDGFLDERLVAGRNDLWGLTVDALTGAVTVVKPDSPTTTVPIFTSTITPTLSGFAQFLVELARGELIPDSSPCSIPLRAEVELGGAVNFDQLINWWDVKNVGQAIQELVSAESGTKYRLEHRFNDGVWESVMVFNQTADAGTARDYTIKSDREAKEYGLSVDASDKASRVYGIGAGSEAETLFAVAFDDDTEANLPEHQVTVAWKDQTIQDKINSLTSGYLSDHRDPVAIPSAKIVGLPDYDPDAPGYDPQKGFPGPDILQPGDTFDVEIGYGVITCRNLTVQCLGVSWSLSQGSTAERTIAMQPLVRANVSIRGQVPIVIGGPTVPTDTTNPPPSPWPTAGKVTTVAVSALTEISGMEASVANPGTVVLFNDEVNTSQVRYVNLSDGKQFSAVEFDTGLPSAGDPESIRYSRKTAVMALADTGDNDLNRPTSGANQPALYVFAEPVGGGTKQVAVTKLPIRYPGGEKVNVETLLIHPTTDHVWLVSKEKGRARVFGFGPLTAMGTGSGDNVGQLVATINELSMVSDGCHTWAGDFVLFRQAGEGATGVFRSDTWAKAGFISTPSMTKSEAICAESSCAFLTSTEGKNAPIYRVLIDKKWGATCGTVEGPTGGGTGSTPDPTKTVPGQVINLNGWKITLPTGSSGKPKEVTQPALATFEAKPNFYTDDGAEVIFRADTNGVTTPNSKNPRSELRQMKQNGTDLAAWSNKNETWTMEVEEAFTHLPDGKPHVVGAQVHDGNDDVTVLRKEGDKLYVTKGDDTHYALVASGIGTEYLKVKVIARKGGGIEWYLNDVKVATVTGVYSGCYFKAGCYTQASSKDGYTGYGEVRIQADSLKVERTL